MRRKSKSRTLAVITFFRWQLNAFSARNALDKVVTVGGSNNMGVRVLTSEVLLLFSKKIRIFWSKFLLKNTFSNGWKFVDSPSRPAPRIVCFHLPPCYATAPPRLLRLWSASLIMHSITVNSITTVQFVLFFDDSSMATPTIEQYLSK